jgi:hypothetical protein
MHLAVAVAAVTLTVAVPAVAAADGPSPRPAPAAAPTYDIGIRVGGYGFKREGDDRPGEGWTECRMNGIGVFASRALRGPLFLEGGLDMYASADLPLGPSSMDLPIDRASGLLSAAIGVRTQLAPWLRAYVQVGAGVEVTRVAVPYSGGTVRDTKAMPEGLFGFGGDLRLAGRTYVGAGFRMLAMGNFDYSRAELEQREEWGFTAPDPAVVFDASLGFAAQGQFYVRREL